MSHPLNAPVPALLLAIVLMYSVFGCSGMSPPVLRSSAPQQSFSIPADGSDPAAAECRQIRDAIRANQELVRVAPTTTNSPEILEAAQGKAELHIDALRSRYAELDCPSDQQVEAQMPRMAPLPRAPGVSNP